MKLSGIKKGEIVLFVIPADKYLASSMEILKYYCNEKKAACIYVTVNKPYTNLMKILETKKINTQKMFVIDAITPVSAKSQEYDNAVLIGSPKGLTDISISATSAVKSIPGSDKFLFFDSLSTLLIYNDVGSVTKFIHFLVNKMKEWNISGAILTLEKETDPKMLSQLEHFVDRVIDNK